jgi:filamentous hemagglutinin
VASPPPWLAGLLKRPGFKGEEVGNGDGVIADPATELDPTIKAGMPMTTPSGSDVIDGIFKTPSVVDVAKRIMELDRLKLLLRELALPNGLKDTDLRKYK